ncbi:MAG: sugar ABC transporter permease [Cellulomonadaceae bacterium]|nr:sugar ABC transporter permease [Cellulomonadaceae bacterium]
MSTTAPQPDTARPTTATPRNRRQGRTGRKGGGSRIDRSYPLWFYAPSGLIYIVLFAVPTILGFYFAFTRWTLFESKFIGFDNFVTFFEQPNLIGSLRNTLIYAVITSGSKVILGLVLAVLLSTAIMGRNYLRNVVFFPALVSAVGVGLTFQVLLNPTTGLVNKALGAIGIDGPGWLVDPNLALLSVAGIDIWKGVGLATLIYIAGIAAIPSEYFEAARMDGANSWNIFRNIILPLSFPATATVILLSLIGGLRSFDLIWTTTQGGPGFASDVVASVIYKQYQAGFYGLSTAGNVILFIVVAAIVFPLSRWLNKREVSL